MKKTAPPPRRASALAAPADTELPMRLGIAAAVFFALSLLYFFPSFLPGRQMHGTDYLAGSYFFYDFFADRFGAGTLPKWVPYIYGGMPVYANPGSAYHPVHLLGETLLPTGKVIGFIYVVQFWLAGLGMYLLARELGCRAWVAFVAGIAFQFTGVTMSWVYAGHDGRIMVSTMAPLFFFFLHRGVRTESLAPFAGAAATLGFALLSFQIQNSYYLILAGFIWAVFLLFRFGLHRRPAALGKTLVYGFGAIAFAFLLASVNFLPFQDYVGESPRGMEGGRGYEYSISYSMPPVGLLSMAVPEQAGASVQDPNTGEALFPANAGFKLHTEYVGALVIVLLAVGVAFAWRSVYWRFFAGLAVFALSMALGGNTPLYRLYYTLLPGLNRFRAPDLTFYVAAFSLVVMAALTLERLAELRAASAARRVGAPDESGLQKVLWIGLGVVAVAVLGAMMTGGAAVAGEPSRAAGWMRFAIFAGGVTAALWAWTAGKMGSLGAAVLLALLTLTDLWIIDRRFFHTMDGPERAFAADDVVAFLETQPKPNRVWAFSVPGAGIPTWGRGGSKGGDYPMLFGIEQVAGEHPNPLQRWVEYIGAGQSEITDFHNLLGPRDSLGVIESQEGQSLVFNPRPGLLEAANVRYVVSMAPLVHPGLREVHRGSALVYQVANALDRAYLVPAVQKLPAERILPAMTSGGWNPAQTAFVPADADVNLPAGPLSGGARVTAHTEDRVTVQTTASRPALMVLADNDYAGWTARIDGREAPIIRTNHTLRGVVVPQGTHTVEFTFRPGDLYTGFYLYLAGFGLLAAYAVFLLVRGRRRRGDEPVVATEPGTGPAPGPTPVGV